MREDLGEATLEPTPKRLQDARESGDSPRSVDATTAAVLGGCVLAAIVGVPPLVRAGASMMAELLGATDAVETAGVIRAALGWLLILVLPAAAVPAALSLLAGLVQGGFRLVPANASPNLSRLDPVAGVRRVFGLGGWMKLLVDAAKVLAVLAVAGVAAWRMATAVALLPALPLGAATVQLGAVALAVAGKTVAVLLVIGAADWLWQRWRWRRRLRMTRQELLDELRQTEGDPHARSRRRQMARQIAMHRINQAVPGADVVITNPEHLAVAIRYRQGRDRAPLIVAMGADALAARIRQLARDAGVPIVERKPLARALWKNGSVGAEVPLALWKAVAEVLAFVYRLKGRVAA